MRFELCVVHWKPGNPFIVSADWTTSDNYAMIGFLKTWFSFPVSVFISFIQLLSCVCVGGGEEIVVGRQADRR